MNARFLFKASIVAAVVGVGLAIIGIFNLVPMVTDTHRAAFAFVGMAIYVLAVAAGMWFEELDCECKRDEVQKKRDLGLPTENIS
jgi:uncharacterized membrane protein YqjE